jgi:hypothetical protein
MFVAFSQPSALVIPPANVSSWPDAAVRKRRRGLGRSGLTTRAEAVDDSGEVGADYYEKIRWDKVSDNTRLSRSRCLAGIFNGGASCPAAAGEQMSGSLG